MEGIQKLKLPLVSLYHELQILLTFFFNCQGQVSARVDSKVCLKSDKSYQHNSNARERLLKKMARKRPPAASQNFG